MTFIVTTVSLRSSAALQLPPGGVLIRQVEEDESSWARAGYLPGLSRYLGEPPQGRAYHLLVDEGGGYETSNAFFVYPEEEDQPARFVVPSEYRGQIEQVLAALVADSAIGRIVLVLEENGHVTSSDLSPEEAETIDVLGPVTLTEFWQLADLGEILEDSVVVIQC
jgi:hypothetical protein